MREAFANKASDSLASTITNTDTTLTLNDGSAFPSGAGNSFRILVDTEIMLATRSGNVLTLLERGAEGTGIAGHVLGASVTQIVSTGGLQRYGRDNVPGWDGSRPPYRLVDSTGAPLTSASFTAINAATNVTITDAADGSIVLLTTPAASAYAIALARSMPATKQLIAALRPVIQQGGSSGFMHAFCGMRESGSGKLLLFGPHLFSGACDTVIRHYSSPTVLDSTQFDEPVFMPGADAFWLKLRDDGTNVVCSVGDGSQWIDAYSEGRTSYAAGGYDQFIFGTNASGALPIINRLVAWQEG